MSLFDDLPDIIAEVLNDAELGFQTVTLTTTTPGTYDPATGTTSGGSTSTQSVRAVVEDYKGLALLNGLIQAGDKKITLPAANLTTAPKPTDTVTVGSLTYAVVGVSTVQPGPAAVIYELQCRRV